MRPVHGMGCLALTEVNLRGAALALLALASSTSLFAQDAPDWADVGPLFAERCVMCHSGEAAPLGLRLDTFEGARAGSQNGPVLVPGDPDASELVRRIRGQSLPAMPLVGGPLRSEEIALVERWVRAGLSAPNAVAPSPRAGEPTPPTSGEAKSGARPGPGEPVTFAHVEPILLQRCAVCHSDAAPGGPPEGLRLDSYQNVLRGGERLVVLPGRPRHSELLRRVEGTARPRMPFGGPPWLSEDQIRLIRQWIAQGAPDAQGSKAPVPVGREIRLRGILTGERAIDGAEFLVDRGTRIDDRPSIGQAAEIRGVVEATGAVRATRLRDR